ncbi:MAG TPA: hypothetical protein VEJ40_04400 [Pseudolabrys sp.]|nr:hypothetical protein [Pseudolabrys sp.]
MPGAVTRSERSSTVALDATAPRELEAPVVGLRPPVEAVRLVGRAQAQGAQPASDVQPAR